MCRPSSSPARSTSTGKHSSYCKYAGNDLLGFWVSEVVFLFIVCDVWLAVLLYAAT